MDRELSAASEFLASYLAHSHSQFSENLAQVLAQRYDGHWFPAEPERGSAFRALVRTHADLDHSILAAARQAGVPLPELERALTTAPGAKRVELGDRWTLWIDPGCVSLRVDRGDSAATTARDAGRFIEIFGKLPDSLRSLVVPLDRIAAATASVSSSNMAADLAPPASPVKRTRAVQIVAPPGGRNALQAMTNAALQPGSPAQRTKSAAAQPPTALLASPLIIPPTPVRPLPAAEADVFSPTPALRSGAAASAAADGESCLLVPPRSPSPLSAGSAGAAGKKFGHSLSPLSLRPSSPLGTPSLSRQRRSLSRDSSASSMSAGSSDDGELSACDSIFSTGADSTTSSAASSVHALSGVTTIWKGLDAKSRDLVDADGFRIPARPSTSGTGGHARNVSPSSSSLAPPPLPGSRHLFSPSSASSSSSSATARSAPNSPSKPRRRGVRGGQGHRSAESGGHGRSSSISSVTSLGSTAVPTTPSQSQAHSDSGSATTRATTPSGRSSSFSHERSPSANPVATEYSNGLVKVLGGGVLLGCAKSTSSASGAGGHNNNNNNRDGTTRTPNSGPATAEDGSRRRRRERGRGGRGGNGNGRENDRSGATSPFQPVSPNWMPHASPFHHSQQQQQQQQRYQYHGSYPNSPYNHGYPASPMQ